MKTFRPKLQLAEKHAYAKVDQKREDLQNILKAIILALLIISSLDLVRLSPLGFYLNPSHLNLLQDKLAEWNYLAPIVFFLGGALFTAVGVPRMFISILGGIVFGFLWGMLLALAATLLGSLVTFLFTQWLGKPLFQQKVGKYLNAIENHIKTNGFLIVVILRQLPLMCILVNVLIGLSSIPIRTFLLGSVIGLWPETAIFALFGSSVREGFVLRVSIASSLLLLLTLAIRIYYRQSTLAREISGRTMEKMDDRFLMEGKKR